jgi:hypothetical protein
MELIDRRNIIENHFKFENNINVFNKFNNFLYNYLTYNKKILHIDYINQFINYFSNINTNDEILNIIWDRLISHFKQSKYHIRVLCKENNYNISLLNNYILLNSNQRKYISNIFRLENKENFIEESNKKFSEYILFDNIILQIISTEILKLKYSYELDKFTSYMKDIGLYEYDKYIEFYINTLEPLFINSLELPSFIDETLKLVYNLSNHIKIFFDLQKHTYINHDLNYYLTEYIIIDIITIISSFDIFTIKNVLDIYWDNIKIILINSFNNKNKHIKNLLNKIINLLNISLYKSKEFINSLIIDIIYILIKLKLIIKDILYKEIIIEKLYKIIDKDIIFIIHDEIDNLIRNNNYNLAIDFIEFSTKIHNIIEFKNYYYNFLINRLSDHLINMNSEMASLEYDIFNFMKTIIDNKYLYKIYKVITDTRQSINDNLYFKDFINDNLINSRKILFMTMSYDVWNIDYDSVINNEILDFIKLSQLGNYIFKFNEFYTDYYVDKIYLNWHLIYGKVIIEYKNKEITMLPIQYLIFNLFNEIDECNIDTINNLPIFKLYNISNNVINSLIYSKLFKMNSDNKSLIFIDTDDFEINIIELLYSIKEHKQYINELSLAYEYKEITNVNINSILKKNQYMIYNDLFKCTKDSIKIFDLNKKIFDESLKYLIDMDYIKLNENKSYSILYY